jgi:galactokinase
VPESTMRRILPDRLLAAMPTNADLVAWAPGRANLIGEYTDFNDGFVLPFALDACTWIPGRSGGDHLRVTSLDVPTEVVVDIRTGEGPRTGWGAYVTGVVRAALDAGFTPTGFEGVIASDVPRGAGLSSSAALEVALALAILPHPPSAPELATICRRAENVYVGVQSGIMDQLASAAGQEGSAILIDCRALTVRSVPVPPGLTALLIDSGVRRSLTDGRYNEIQSACRSAAAKLGVPALRDADEALVESRAQALDPGELRRARHVVSENRRTLEAVSALEAGDTARVSALFAESHRSMAEDLGISTPEMNLLVRLAVRTPGIVASRLTGGGFGGCTISLVEHDEAVRAATSIVDAYRAEMGREARWWTSTLAAGAGRSFGDPQATLRTAGW